MHQHQHKKTIEKNFSFRKKLTIYNVIENDDEEMKIKQYFSDKLLKNYFKL